MSEANRVKSHFRDNAKLYIGVGIGVAVVLGLAIVLKNDTTSIRNNSVGRDLFVNSQVTQLTRRGHPGYRIRINETGEEFASIRRAAEVLEVDPSRIRQFFKGVLDDVDGFTLTNLGEM